MARVVAGAREAIDRTTQTMTRRLPAIAPLHRQVTQHADTLRHQLLRTTSEARERIAGAVHRIEALSPLATLDRGYALVSRSDGTPASCAADVAAGDVIEVRWSDGSRSAHVDTPVKSGS